MSVKWIDRATGESCLPFFLFMDKLSPSGQNKQTNLLCPEQASQREYAFSSIYINRTARKYSVGKKALDSFYGSRFASISSTVCISFPPNLLNKLHVSPHCPTPPSSSPSLSPSLSRLICLNVSDGNNHATWNRSTKSIRAPPPKKQSWFPLSYFEEALGTKKLMCSLLFERKVIANTFLSQTFIWLNVFLLN